MIIRCNYRGYLYLAFLWHVFAFNFPLLSQSAQSAIWSEMGLPEMHHFRPGDYQGGALNYAITQDSLGLVYVANESGILVYDGTHWEHIFLPANGAAQALCYAQKKICVGGYNQIGYLRSDSSGSWHYVSLNPLLPDSVQNFKAIGEAIAIDDTVYFRSYYALFRWDGHHMRVFRPQTLFFTAFRAGKTLFVSEWGKGLMQVAGDSLRLAPQGKSFARKIIAGIFPYPNGGWEVVTRFEGRFRIDAKGIQPLPVQNKSFWQNSLIYRAVALPDDYVALATHRRGLAIADRNGRLLQVVDRAAGLRDQTVNFVHRDAQGGLWLALTNGLARVEVPSAFTTFDYRSGLDGTVLSIVRHNQTLFVGTNRGLFRLRPSIDPPARFQKIDGIHTTVYTLVSFRGKLFVGSHRGLYVLQNNTVRLVPTGGGSIVAMLPSQRHSGQMFLGTYQDVRLLDLADNGKEKYNGILLKSGFVKNMLESDDGAVWVASRQGVYRLRLSTKAKDLQVTHFDSARGVPPNIEQLFLWNGKVHLLSQLGMVAFQSNAERFAPATGLRHRYVKFPGRFQRVFVDTDGKLWILGSRNNRPFCHKWVWHQNRAVLADSLSAYRLAGLGLPRIIYSEGNGIVWVGGTEGLLRVQPALRQRNVLPFPIIIRRVIAGDSLYFAPQTVGIIEKPLSIPFTFNDLRFYFTAPHYQSVAALHYRYYLQGYDQAWSQWQVETYRDYTGLPPGEYRFWVQARNGLGQLSREISFAFRILPPWYRTFWAYGAYGVLGIFLIIGLIQWRVRHLKRKTRQLERIVNERTATIRQQAQRLAELDKLKSRFLANISHEFRTPLTLILGPLEDWLAETHRDDHRQTTWWQMHRAARRLLRLVNQLLDLSRLEAGKLTLTVTCGDFRNFLRNITLSFASLADQKNICLRFTCAVSETALQEAWFDADKMETIFSNLLSNALKFTPSGGEVTVTCQCWSAEEEKVNGGESAGHGPLWVEVCIRDTGAGIPPEQLPHIFERFYQSKNAQTRTTDGVGIGLALVKELTELHHGNITVESKPQKGTTFRLHFPLHRSAYTEEEIHDVPLQINQPPSAQSEAAAGFGATSTNLPNRRLPLVLVVEDHSDVRRYLAQHLQSSYRVLEAGEGQTAFKLAVKHIPDVIISDVMMPRMDGYELCTRLKEDIRTSHIPIILLTARAGEESKMTGLEIGADDYLTKPFNARELLVRVRNLIEQRRRLQRHIRREGLLETLPVTMSLVEKTFQQRLQEATEAGIEQEGFGPRQLSQTLGMSGRTLQRKIHALTGQSPSAFIRSVRLRRARQLLEQGVGNVSQICFKVGFENLPYFTRCFKEEFGMPPSQVLKERIG